MNPIVISDWFYLPLTGFATSLITCYFLVLSHVWHKKYTEDSNLYEPQKIHKNSVSRIGGVAVLLGFFNLIFLDNSLKKSTIIYIFLVTCIFFIGFLEDLYKNIPAKKRLLMIFIVSMCAILLTDLRIINIGIAGPDYLLNFYIISFLVSSFAIAGLTNSYNIIDGFNGLSSMIGMIGFFGIAVVALLAGDNQLAFLCCMMISSIFGFFILNYPNGKIFLGDGGAYLIGFIMSISSLELINRNPNLSPWFVITINLFPIIETLFTIYRRIVQKNKKFHLPDAIHLHTLIYRRITRKIDVKTANPRTSHRLWLLSLLTLIPSIIFRNSTILLIVITLLYSALYITMYRKIVLFKTPKWLYSNLL